MMTVVSASGGNGLVAQFSPIFGRCSSFVLVDTETMACETVPNRAMSQSGGAGIQAAQDVINMGAETVITGSVGPNAYGVLAAAGVPIYTSSGATVGQAVEQFKAGNVAPAGGPTNPGHFADPSGGGGRGLGAGGSGRSA